MAVRKTIPLIGVFICSFLVSNSPLANEGNRFDSKREHFATTIKKAGKTKPIRLIEPVNNKAGTVNVSSVKTLNVKKSTVKTSTVNTGTKVSRAAESSSLNDCTVDNLYTLTGDALVNFIVGCTHADIIQAPFFDFNAKTEQLFSEANMISMAKAIETRAASYSRDNRQGLAELMLISRAGFYVAFYFDSLNYTSAANDAFNTATQAFSSNVHFLDTDDEHAVVLSEWVDLVDGSENWITAYDDLSSILEQYPTQAVDETTYDAITVLYAVQLAIWRAQNNNPEFYELINNDEKTVDRYVRLANAMKGYMGTDYESAYTNVLRKLGLLLSYSNHTESAKAAITTLLAEYTRLSVPWLNLAFAINDFGDCTQFDSLCADDVKPELMDIAFPNTFTFDDGNLVVRTAIGLNKAQALYHAQKQVEAQFKRKNQALLALASDENEVLTMFVYGTLAEYEQYQPFLFDLDTDNGGMYIESWGQFFTYQRTAQESIYTLEELFRHEYVHYLHGRYTIEGLWGETEMYQNSRLTWFEEGGAEFFAGSSQANDVQLRKIMIENISWDDGDHMSVSEIVNASYSDGFKFYRYSALFFNFLNETQPQTIIDLHKIIRSDDVAAFDVAVDNFANDAQLQADYSDYLTRKISKISNMNDFTRTSFPMPTQLDTDLVSDIQTDMETAEVFASTTCNNSATTINARFECSGTVIGSDYNDLNTQIDAGIIKMNHGLNNFTTMNCALGSLTIGVDTVSAPYSCKGGLRDAGTEQIRNQAPTANAGEDMTIGLREDTVISGSASTDPEDNNLTYSWSQTGGELVDNVDPSGGFDKMTFSFYAYEQHEGTELTFELTVSDGEYSSTDEVVITVGVLNNKPIANAGEDQTVNEGDSVTLAGTATDTDGDELSLNWTQISGLAVTLTNGVFVAPDVNETTTLAFELTADDGQLTGTDTVTITVNNVEATTTTPPTETKKKSSGGSFGVYGLVLFSLMALRRKQLRKLN